MENKLPELEFEGRTAIMGIGNKSKGDDGAGVKVVEGVRKRVDSEQVIFIEGGTVPEKFTSKIKKFEPDQILLIDSVEIGADPGTISIVDPEGIVEEKISSHRLPLSMLMKYLEDETEGKAILLGIQPELVGVGTTMSKAVQETVENLIRILEGRLTR